MALLSRLLGWLRRGAEIAVILLFIYMVTAIAVQVLGRYVFNYSIAGTEETAVFAQVWMVLIGAGIAMRNGQHVGVDVLISRCPARVRQVVSIAAAALCLWFLAVLFRGSFALIEVGGFQSAPATNMPMTIPYLALPIGVLYFALEFVIAMWPSVLGRPIHVDEDARKAIE